MYAFIQGVLEAREANHLVINVSGVGYLICASASTIANAGEPGSTVRLYTHLVVREDALELYGFFTLSEKRMFQRLIAISGVGPKIALALLGQMSPSELSLALVAQDAKAIAKTPGLGLKTAQKIILELKDHVTQDDFFEAGTASSAAKAALDPNGAVTQEAIEALVALGYQSAEAAKAVGEVREQADTVNELVRLALKTIAL